MPHWNALVANLEMHGKGNFFDPRLSNKEQYPVAARANLGNVRASEDRITPKLAALHFYQLGITAPRLKTLGLVDKVVTEPHGGAHRDHAAMMATLKKALTDALRHAQERPLDVLLDAREDKLLGYGKFKEITAG